MARVRSPNYPAIALPDAIQRIGKVFDAEQHIPAAKEVVAKDLGYGGLNGASMKIISALIKYGLLEETGDQLKVSERAIFILHPPDSETKGRAIFEAAFSPTLFSDFREQWGSSVPSDANMTHYLLRRNFAQSAIGRILGAYKETIELVARESQEHDFSLAAANEKPVEPLSSAQRGRQPASPAVGGMRVSIVDDRLEVSANLIDAESVEKLIRVLSANKELLPERVASDISAADEGLEHGVDDNYD